ncbi:MAG: ATPase, partial [Anaerolineae bacterium]
TPQDVKSLAPDVLRHRIIPSYEAEAEQLSATDIVDLLLSTVPVP